MQASLDYNAYIVPGQKGLSQYSFIPYIFTHDQIRSVIKVADETVPRGVAKNMHLALPVIFRIGMAVREGFDRHA